MAPRSFSTWRSNPNHEFKINGIILWVFEALSYSKHFLNTKLKIYLFFLNSIWLWWINAWEFFIENFIIHLRWKIHFTPTIKYWSKFATYGKNNMFNDRKANVCVYDWIRHYAVWWGKFPSSFRPPSECLSFHSDHVFKLT